MSLVRINKNPSLHDLRMFAGVWWPLYWALVGVLVWRRSGSLYRAELIWGTAAAIAIVCLLAPALARVLSVGLSYATFPIGFVISHILVTLIFYLVITPAALVLRLFGHDALHLRPAPSADTYWIAREAPRDPRSYFLQY